MILNKTLSLNSQLQLTTFEVKYVLFPTVYFHLQITIICSFSASLFALFQLVTFLEPFHSRGRNFPSEIKISHTSCSIFFHLCNSSHQLQLWNLIFHTNSTQVTHSSNYMSVTGLHPCQRLISQLLRTRFGLDPLIS